MLHLRTRWGKGIAVSLTICVNTHPSKSQYLYKTQKAYLALSLPGHSSPLKVAQIWSLLHLCFLSPMTLNCLWHSSGSTLKLFYPWNQNLPKETLYPIITVVVPRKSESMQWMSVVLAHPPLGHATQVPNPKAIKGQGCPYVRKPCADLTTIHLELAIF